jgi:hypothetical protein
MPLVAGEKRVSGIADQQEKGRTKDPPKGFRHHYSSLKLGVFLPTFLKLWRSTAPELPEVAGRLYPGYNKKQ